MFLTFNVKQEQMMNLTHRSDFSNVFKQSLCKTLTLINFFKIDSQRKIKKIFLKLIRIKYTATNIFFIFFF